MIRTKTVTAGNGGARVYVEESRRPLIDAPGICGESVTAFLAKDRGAFVPIFAQKANREWPSNSLTVVDWSPDGHYVLLELRQSNAEGEKLAETPLVYDTLERRIYRLNLLKLFQGHFRRKCAVNASLKGFTAGSEVVVAATPQEPDTTYESLQLPSCVVSQTRFAVDFRKGRLRQISVESESGVQVRQTP
ncbi:MAG TPA: hypothetical protein VE178_21010 [Silvibacterium sp.]|nr:hypothetical protein [Silvibacterium sp.]